MDTQIFRETMSTKHRRIEEAAKRNFFQRNRMP
jgi:ribosomal protein S21